MFKSIRRLYDDSRLNKSGVAKAVVKGWLTAAEYEIITGEDYDA